MMITTADLNAQKLSYELNVDSRSYQALAERNAENGISPADFGRWLAENVTVSETNDFIERGRKWSDTGKLTLLAIDHRGGIIGSQSLPMRMSARAAPLGRLINAAQLGRTIGQIVNIEFVKPDPDFLNPVHFPDPDHWAPDRYPAPDNWAREVQDVASDQARRTLGRMSGESPVAIILLVSPDADELYDKSTPKIVQPAGLVFCATGRH